MKILNYCGPLRFPVVLQQARLVIAVVIETPGNELLPRGRAHKAMLVLGDLDPVQRDVRWHCSAHDALVVGGVDLGAHNALFKARRCLRRVRRRGSWVHVEVEPVLSIEAHDISRQVMAEAFINHEAQAVWIDRKSTRLNSSHANISYAVFCLKKKQT